MESDGVLLVELVHLFGAGNVFTKVDLQTEGVRASNTPLRDAEMRMRSLPENKLLGVFSFPLFGRSFVVARAMDIWQMMTSAPRSESNPKVFDVHEHYGFEGRPFQFFMDLDSKEARLASLDNAAVLKEIEPLREIVQSLFPQSSDALTLVVFRSDYEANRKLSLHVVFRGFRVPNVATAKSLAHSIEERWISVLTRSFDKCFRLHGSLRMPWAAKWKTPTAIKHPISLPEMTGTEAFYAGLLNGTIAHVLSPVPEVEVQAFQAVDDWAPILSSLRELLQLPGELRVLSVRKEMKPSVFAPSLLPSRVFVHFVPGSTPCPFANRTHRRAPLTLILTPNGPLFKCMHGACGGARAFKPSEAAKPSLFSILEHFFGSRLALDEVCQRHVAFPAGRFVSYLTRLKHRDAIGSAFLSIYRTPLNVAYSNRFFFDGLVACPQSELLDAAELHDQRLATSTFFDPIPLADCLNRENTGFVLKEGRVNVFEAPPLVDSRACAEHGEFLKTAFDSFFEDSERDAFYSYLAYLVRHGRPAVALCLLGPEGCGKSTIFKILLSWFAPHVVTFNQEAHIQEDKFNSALMEKTIVLFDDCEKLVRNFVYDLITTTTAHGIRKMHQEWSAARLHTTVFIAFNPAKNPIPFEFGHQRRFLVLDVLPKPREPGFWPHFIEAAEKGGSRYFIERYLLARPEDFVLGEAVQTPTYLRERSSANPFAVFVGDVLMSRRFPIARGPGRPLDEQHASRFVELRVDDLLEPLTIMKRPGTWWLGFKYLFEELHGPQSTDPKALSSFLAHIFKPDFSSMNCRLAPWKECILRYQSDFSHDQLDNAFPKPMHVAAYLDLIE